MESILKSIKKLLGIADEDHNFDTDIVIHINTIFMTLNDLGVGPSEGFTIEDEESKWYDFIPDNKMFDSVKTYVYLKVKLLFDPPLSSSVIDAIERSIKELEWRITDKAERAKSV